MARYTCPRCKADCNTLDDPHICKDIKKRLERQTKAVELVANILDQDIGEIDNWEVALKIVKALSGRDLGVD